MGDGNRNSPSLAILRSMMARAQKHRSGPGFAVEEPEAIFSHLLLAKADDLVLPATGQKEQPDDIDLLALRWTGLFRKVMAVEYMMKSAEFLP